MLKINYVKAHQRVGPLRKTYHNDPKKAKSYPKASKMTSKTMEYDTDSAGLYALAEDIKEFGSEGFAILRGVLEHPLKNESRRNKVDKNALSQHLVLDVDGWINPAARLIPPLDKRDVERCAKLVIDQLPEYMSKVMCVANASSSFGRKEDVISLHLHFFLDTPVSSAMLKLFLKNLNFCCEGFTHALKLTPTGDSVKFIIDPCMGENNRILYIAPPEFAGNTANPFGNDTDRVAVVVKGKTHLDVYRHMPVPEDVRTKEIGHWKRLCKESGLPAKEKRTKQYEDNDGTKVTVLSDPNQVFMEYAGESDDFVRYNINGGDSGAYWVKKNNPEIVYSFKAGERPFLFRVACPDVYEQHVKQYGMATKTKLDETTGQLVEYRPLIVIDKANNRFYKIDHCVKTNRALQIHVTDRSNANDYLMQHGQVPPDYYPTFDIEFNPHTDRQVDVPNKFINRFNPSDLISMKDKLGAGGSYGKAGYLVHVCPHIYALMYHMLGSDDETYEHFVNWFAYAVQARDKCKTSWLLHGTEGTGKGLFFHRVIRPIFGRHCAEQTLDAIAEDTHNGWIEDQMMLMVDEFNVNESRSSTTRAMNMLKHLITENTMQVRAMHQDRREVRNFLNFIFATNDVGALKLSDNDRRFNIAPRQEVRLSDVYPEVNQTPEVWDAALEVELPDFMRFINAFEVNVAQVRRLLQNEAREETRIAGKNAQERMVDALSRGDIQWFTNQIFIDASQMLASELPKRAGVQTILKRWLENIENGQDMLIPINDIRAIYSFLSGKELSSNAFGRLVNSIKMEKIQSRHHYGRKTATNNVRCLLVQWKYDVTDINELRAQLDLLPSVKSMKSYTDSDFPEYKESQ